MVFGIDLGIIFSSLIDLTKLLLITSIIGFVLFKIFSPLREKFAEKYSLSWSKSCLFLNFIIFFVLILVVFVLFMVIGFLDAPLREPGLEYDFFENVLLVLIAVPRIFISALILSLVFFFFELIASMFMRKEEIDSIQPIKIKTRKKQVSSSNWLDEFKGIAISSLVFLILLLFVFNWVPLGLFIYIFYGSLSQIPLLFSLFFL